LNKGTSCIWVQGLGWLQLFRFHPTIWLRTGNPAFLLPPSHTPLPVAALALSPLDPPTGFPQQGDGGSQGSGKLWRCDRLSLQLTSYFPDSIETMAYQVRREPMIVITMQVAWFFAYWGACDRISAVFIDSETSPHYLWLGMFYGVVAWVTWGSASKHYGFFREATRKGWRYRGWDWLRIIPGSILREVASIPERDANAGSSEWGLRVLITNMKKSQRHSIVPPSE